jgi:hypothetical protein
MVPADPSLGDHFSRYAIKNDIARKKNTDTIIFLVRMRLLQQEGQCKGCREDFYSGEVEYHGCLSSSVH